MDILEDTGTVISTAAGQEGWVNMDRGAEIIGAIAQAIDNLGLFRSYGDDHVVTADRARQVSASIFEVLDKGGYLNPNTTTEREKRIVQAITQAIGNSDRSPGAYHPGQWYEIAVRPTLPGLDMIADAVYKNLVYLGYITAPDRDDDHHGSSRECER